MMASKTSFIFIAFLAAMLAMAGCLGVTPQSFIGGTVLSLSPVDITNDPTIPFSKEVIANVLLDGGGNYLVAAQSPLTTVAGATETSKPFRVDFQMSSYSCAYTIATSANTLSGLEVKSYRPPNVNDWSSGNQWSVLCRYAAAVNNFFPTQLYNSYSAGQDSFGNAQYCNVPLTSGSCRNDFIQQCINQPGYHIVSCTVPNSQTDAFLQSLFGAQPYGGISCVKVQDNANSFFAGYDVTSKQPDFTASLTVTPQSGSPETILLNSANAYSAHSADVYVKSTANLGSNQNPPCPTDANIEYIGGSSSGVLGVVSKTSYGQLLSTYTNVKNTNAADLATLLWQVNSFDAQLSSAITASSINTAYQSGWGGELRLDRSSNPPNLPWLTLYINAPWVGIVNPVAIPSLVCPQPISYTCGNVGSGTFSVTNNGAAGGITVGAPTCTPSASFVWVNNPNRNYGAPDTYNAAFTTTASPGEYQCSITAQSSGPVLDGNYHETSCTFTMDIAPCCTNTASPPKYRCPTEAEPCKVCCPLDPEIAGFDACAQSGLIYNATECVCNAPPNCVVTNTCPTDCNDGTHVGLCNVGGYRCNVVAGVSTLQVDSTCSVPCEQTGTCPPPPIACTPFFEKMTMQTVGGINILFWNIGGTQAGKCVPDFVNISLIFLGVALLMLVIGFAMKRPGKPLIQIALVVGVVGVALLVLAYIAENSTEMLVAAIALAIVAVIVAVGWLYVKR